MKKTILFFLAMTLLAIVQANPTCLSGSESVITEYVISASANPTYGGTVNGYGTFQYGEICTLRATANSGFSFTNWTENGNVVSTEVNFSFQVFANRNLVANFANLPIYSINTTSNPTVGGTTTGYGNFPQGTMVTIHATPESGYAFTNWTENGAQVSAYADYTFEVNGNHSFVANFTRIPTHSVSTTSSPLAGGITSGGGTFQHGQTITVCATAYGGYTFINWTENGVQISTNSDYTFDVTSDRHLVANFTVISNYVVNTMSNPIEGGSTSGGGTFQPGQSCTVHANANPGYTFVNWTENGEEVSINLDYYFDVFGNHNLVANFDFVEYEISALCNLDEGCTIIGTGTYHYGDEVTLDLLLEPYYFFESWTENGDTISLAPQLTFVVDGPRQLMVNIYYYDAVNDNELHPVQVYPNPANDVIFVEGDALEVWVYNAFGQLVASQKNDESHTMQISVAQLPSGIYAMTVRTPHGTLNRVFIKE